MNPNQRATVGRDEPLSVRAREVFRDQEGRSVHTLRVAVTKDCNLRCRYCDSGREDSSNGAAPAPDRLLQAIGCLEKAFAFQKIRFTGGEPLLCPGLLPLIRGISSVGAEAVLALTTNGTLLQRWSDRLIQAGVKRFNVSLDALSPEVYSRVSGGGDVDLVLRGLRGLQSAEDAVVKLNCVLLPEENRGEWTPLTRFALRRGWELRFIERIPRPGEISRRNSDRTPFVELQRLLSQAFELRPLGRLAGTTAERYAVAGDGLSGVLGFIPAVTGSFCSDCGRLRLDSNGRLWRCLFSRRGYPLMERLETCGKDEVFDELVEYVFHKPPTPAVRDQAAMGGMCCRGG